MRTVFLGTSEFAAGVLERLAASAHRPALAVSRPDRPKGRGRKLASPPLAKRAQAFGIPLAQPESVNTPEVLAQIENLRPDMLLVCAFGALIKEPLLSSHPILNVHPSLLPRWRGAAPIERAIMAGDDRTGVCIMQLTAGLDSGPVCFAAQEPIGAQDDYGSLAQRLCVLGGELLVQALDRLGGGQQLSFQEQDETQATYAEKIEAADRLLDPACTAIELERVVRALHPHIGARLALPDGSMLGVHRAGAMPALDEVEVRQGELSVHGEHLLYGLASGQALELLEVQPAGGKAMDAKAYMRGHAF
ncbi:MAG TPA: methionyl-tRNA formyltransferase [Solirubrobacteraceae bacterium]|nr:methionyl-tRNA formyltransferase [Solirubrobacteraceae bacterium]